MGIYCQIYNQSQEELELFFFQCPESLFFLILHLIEPDIQHRQFLDL